jgi:hypothetical protein
MDSYDSGWGQMTDCSEHVNEASGSIKGDELLEQLSDYQLLNKDSAP